jgi:hypothetical protein
MVQSGDMREASEGNLSVKELRHHRLTRVLIMEPFIGLLRNSQQEIPSQRNGSEDSV